MITVGMLAKIRRMHFRDHLSLREIAKRTGFSRNTVRSWLLQAELVQPAYSPSISPSLLDPYKDQLQACLKIGRNGIGVLRWRCFMPYRPKGSSVWASRKPTPNPEFSEPDSLGLTANGAAEFNNKTARCVGCRLMRIPALLTAKFSKMRSWSNSHERHCNRSAAIL